MDDTSRQIAEEQGFLCPECQSTDFKTWAFPHPLIIHWVLNPGIAVNELLLGQRIPTLTYFCDSCGESTTWARYYRCPDCGAFHQEAIWTGSNGFAHWFGIYCRDCGSEIPCVLNVISWVVLARLSPINWLLRWLFGRRYITWEQSRARASRDLIRNADRDAKLTISGPADLMSDEVVED